jgi:hypothetical protein
MTRIPSLSLTIAAALFTALSSTVAGADTVVQVPLPDLLDARSVTTLTAGQLVVFTLPTDGGNLQNAFATAAVAELKGKPVENCLPNDGRFPANDRHPEVVLHFSNAADAASPQTHLVAPSASFSFAVPEATYSKLFLFFNGAAGGTTVNVTLNYADAMDTQNATVPDYYADISATDPVVFNLATDLAKWDKSTAINEANHHNITGVTLNALAGKTLQTVKVERGAEGNLVFWGATGIATSELGGGGSGGAGGVSNGGMAGGGSGGGSGGIGGGAAGGESGMGGAAGINTNVSGTNSSSAGAATTAGGGAALLPNQADADSGCGCRLVPGHGSPARALGLAFGALLARCVRRKRGRL